MNGAESGEGEKKIGKSWKRTRDERIQRKHDHKTSNSKEDTKQEVRIFHESANYLLELKLIRRYAAAFVFNLRRYENVSGKWSCRYHR